MDAHPLVVMLLSFKLIFSFTVLCNLHHLQLQRLQSIQSEKPASPRISYDPALPVNSLSQACHSHNEVELSNWVCVYFEEHSLEFGFELTNIDFGFIILYLATCKSFNHSSQYSYDTTPYYSTECEKEFEK